MTNDVAAQELLSEIWKASSGDRTIAELISSALISSYKAGYDAGVQTERLRCLEATLPGDVAAWTRDAIWASNHIRDLITLVSK